MFLLVFTLRVTSRESFLSFLQKFNRRREIMCMNSSTPISSSDFFYSFVRRSSSKRHNVRVRHLNRWRRPRRRAVGANKMMLKDGVAKMEIKNLKLYMENQSIREENERLREKALLLHQENQSLLAQLQKKLCNPQTT